MQDRAGGAVFRREDGVEEWRPGAPPRPRGHLDLARENDGLVPWCGPAAIALATGCGLQEAGTMLRDAAPHWYPGSGPIVTTYWRDLLAVLGRCGVPHAARPPAPGPRPTLLDFLRRGGEEGAPLSAGWYLLRVTGHFLLLRGHGFGLGEVHDNRHSGALVTAARHGRRRISHAAHLLGGPLLAA